MEDKNKLIEMRQKLCAELGYDVAKASEAFKFIMFGTAINQDDPYFAIATADILKLEEVGVIPKDGVYFVMKDGSRIHIDEAGSEVNGENVKYIGIKLGSRSLCVALENVTDHAVKLTTEKVLCGTAKTNIEDAISDWDGKGNTEKLRPYLNPEIKLEEGEWIPSCGELHFILMHLKDVNRALRMIGRQAIPDDDWYWASSECNSYYSWGVHFSSGFMGGNLKCNTGCVRAVAAF